MGTDHEVALIRAACRRKGNQELYWIFSRTQVEFVLKELELVETSAQVLVARYQEMILPVLSLESHFAVSEIDNKDSIKYIVLRSVDQRNTLQRLIIRSSFSPQFLKINNSIDSLAGFSTLRNNEQVLGAYSLGGDKVGVVPDVVKICHELGEIDATVG